MSDNIDNTDAIIIHHQGWTDIINCLGLVRYSCEKLGYNKCALIIREDAYELVNYVLKDIPNLVIVKKKHLDISNTNRPYIKYIINNVKNTHRLFYGRAIDTYYLGKIKKKNTMSKNFVNDFYSNYNIEPINRIDMFKLNRDTELEDKRYKEVIDKVSKKEYVLIHYETSNHSKKKYGINIKKFNIDHINDKYRELPKFNLDQSSDLFFDMIKVFENAKEIHLMESVWCAVIYLLQKKYGLLKDIKIYIHEYIRPRGLHVLYPNNGWIWLRS